MCQTWKSESTARRHPTQEMSWPRVVVTCEQGVERWSEGRPGDCVGFLVSHLFSRDLETSVDLLSGQAVGGVSVSSGFRGRNRNMVQEGGGGCGVNREH